MATAVIVARMQVYDLTDRHRAVIEKIMQAHERTVFFLRASKVPSTKNNPLDANTRKAMLRKAFPALDIFIIEDQPLKELWSEKLDSEIEKHVRNDAVLHGAEADLATEYCGKHTVKLVKEIAGVASDDVHASEGEQSTVLFRKGVFYAVKQQYPKVYPTVDIAIFRDGRLLLARKPGVNGYRFIGGFSDPTDESYEAAAAREAEEETGIRVKNIAYAGSARVDDWRYRNEQDKIITMLFTAEFAAGEAGAKDDISEIEWFLPSELNEEMFVHEHRPLYRILKEKNIV